MYVSSMGGDPGGRGRAPWNLSGGIVPLKCWMLLFSVVLNECFSHMLADDVINQQYNISAIQKGHPHPFVASAFRPPPPDITRNRRHGTGKFIHMYMNLHIIIM